MFHKVGTALGSPSGSSPSHPLTPHLWWIWSLAGMGILLDGFDLFIIGMALPLLQADWGLSAGASALLAAATPAGAVCGALCVGPIIDRVGRRRVLLVCPFLFILATAGCSLAPSFDTLLLGRLLLGLGIGADYPLSASYIAEFMPASIRGRMMVGAFSLQSLGALLGALSGVLVLLLDPTQTSWRLMLGLGIIPAVIVWLCRLHAPETPMWKGLTQSQKNLSLRSVSLWKQRLALACIPWFILDIVLYGIGLFSPLILVSAYTSLTGQQTLSSRNWLSNDLIAGANTVVLDLFWMVGFALAIVLVERWGRALLQSIGFIGMAMGLALACWGVISLPLNIPLMLLGIALCNLCATMGPNATTYLLPAELFPTEVRATAHGLASAFGKLGAVSSACALPAINRIGMEGTFGIAALLCLLAAMVTLVLAQQIGLPQQRAVIQ